MDPILDTHKRVRNPTVGNFYTRRPLLLGKKGFSQIRQKLAFWGHVSIRPPLKNMPKNGGTPTWSPLKK